MSAKTLYDKLWDSHVVRQEADGTALIYIDRQLVHEVTSPQAFEGLKLAHRKPWRTASMLAVPDHNVPTTNRAAGIADPISRLQVETLDANCAEFGVTEFKMNDIRQGIVHVIGPEQGATLPGMTVVCGDSHTSTHGAFAALAHGIGTSEVEHVMATQCLVAKKSKAMLVKVEGVLGKGVTAKDIALAIDRQDRHGGRYRLCHRVCGQCDPRLEHGRPHDLVQYGHRSGRARRHGGGGRGDLCLLQRASFRAARARIGKRPWRTGVPCIATRAPSSMRPWSWMHRRSSRK